MVKVINIDTKTRTIRIDNADSDIKTWRTTETGTHFPIKKGETTKEALDKFVEKKRPEAKKESDFDEGTWVKAYKQAMKVYGPKKGGLNAPTVDEVKAQYDKLKQQPAKKESAKPASTKSDSTLVSAVAKALGTSAEDAETEINGAVQHIKDLIKAKDLRNGDVEETLQGLGLEPDYAEEFMQWVSAPSKKKKESGLLGDKPTPDELLKTPKAREVYDRLTRYASEHNKDLQEDDMKHLRSLRDILLDDNNAAEHVEKNFQKWFGSGKSESAQKESVPDRMMRYKNTMQETMDSFGTLYSWEKPHLEEFAKKIYDDISKNPEKEKEFLEHTYEAYDQAAKRLGMWVDTPTLVKRSFLKKLLDGQEQKDDTEAEESRWGNAGLGTAFYDLKK